MTKDQTQEKENLYPTNQPLPNYYMYTCITFWLNWVWLGAKGFLLSLKCVMNMDEAWFLFCYMFQISVGSPMAT